MKKFVNILRREQGLTLIELIAAMTIFTLVAGLVSAVIMFGIRTYNQVSVENTLRDEGDLLMSAVITEMYTFAADTVTATASEFDSNHNIIGSSIILVRDGAGGASEEITIEDEEMSIVKQDNSTAADTMTSISSRLAPGSSILLQCSNVGSCDSGLINIKLNLLKAYGGKDYTLTLESTFGF